MVQLVGQVQPRHDHTERRTLSCPGETSGSVIVITHSSTPSADTERRTRQKEGAWADEPQDASLEVRAVNFDCQVVMR